MSAAALVLALTAAAAPVYEREIEVPEPGAVSVRLDRHVYEAARLDLGDLRVLDAEGREVPYVLDRFAEAPPPLPWQPPLLNRSDDPGRSTQVTLDLGVRAPRHALELELSGDNFRRRVRVEASDDAESWRVLTDAAWVFAVPGPPPARFETVRFPLNDQRHLRVTVFHGPDDPARIRIGAARVVPAPLVVPAQEWLDPRASRSEDGERHETRLVLDLGARHQPFLGVELEVADARFFRRVVVEARREPLPASRAQAVRPLQWIRVGEGEVHRYGAGDGPVDEQLRLDVAGRARVLRLRIQNRDDRPLAISRARVAAPVERVAFEAGSAGRYRLRYGDPDLDAPRYDLPLTVGSAAAWAEAAVPVPLADAVQVAGPVPAPVPWSERHPRLLLAGLLLVVAALAALTRHALRSAG